ncbi:MAG TPA: helicase-related protein, partial [Candidatus Wallbacteria bacterium]|nr:helicase-related protein [Candidatus Wallbacteria bacterium]
MTATPDRMDNRDIYSLCDQNIAYEVNLKKAIESQWLVPFAYHAIYDETINYENIKYVKGKYDEAELERVFINSDQSYKRADIIRDKYLQYRRDEKTLTVAFCSSINHANYMAENFLKHGIAAVPLHSAIADFFKNERITALCKKNTGNASFSRHEAISAFESRKIKVLFVVDIFNEGVDIPHIEMELFLRPTESFTIFLQQLGRGLRLCEGKNNLVVLDFIGNYKKANFKPLLLSGQSLRDFDGKLRAVDYIKTKDWLPDSCYA